MPPSVMSNQNCNGHERALEFQTILSSTVSQLTEFLQCSDDERSFHQRTSPADEVATATCLVNSASTSPTYLREKLSTQLAISSTGRGATGLEALLKLILKYSVNPSAPGYLDKLYAAPLPPGIAAELVLGVLNTNLHVYQVSPVLTLIEKTVTKDLARLFGLKGARSGGISVQGGSASNLTSIVIARNTLFPETKSGGNSAVPGRLLLFTSAHGHYSIDKAAQALGLGSNNVVPVPVDEDGQMRPAELERLVLEAKAEGEQPFYINTTAGTTVLGSFDPFDDIAVIAKKYGLWMHVDAAWGGGFVFSDNDKLKKSLRGIGLADSIATNPHKMLGAPLTCSFLLGNDLKQFQDANTLKAGYLFHDNELDEVETHSDTEPNDETAQSSHLAEDSMNHTNGGISTSEWHEPWDLADLTLQCGRRGDSLKFYLAWQYYGTAGYTSMVDQAYHTACYMSRLVDAEPDLTPVLGPGKDPSCLQVCFYFTPNGKFTYGLSDEAGHLSHPMSETDGTDQDDLTRVRNLKTRYGKLNTRITSRIAKSLIPKGFMIDHAPALEGQEDRGNFFRVVINISTIPETVQRLVHTIVATGRKVVAEI